MSFKMTVKEKVKNSKFLYILDFINQGQWPPILFIVLFFHSLAQYINNPNIIFITDLFSLTVMLLIYPLALFVVSIFFNFDKLYFYFSRYFFKTSLLFFISLGLFYFFIGGLKAVIHSFPYICYAYNIFFLFCNTKLIKANSELLENLSSIKIASFLILFISFISYVMLLNNDPMYTTVFICSIPFYFCALFIKSTESLNFMYRILFIVILFFLSSIVTPYLIFLSLVMMWFGKFYYFIKSDLKFPSFYNTYDISK